MIREILLLGNPALYNISAPVMPEEIPDLKSVITDLHDTLLDFRSTYGAGRAIAAPQIGVPKRLIYMYITSNTGTGSSIGTDRPVVFINPKLSFPTREKIEVMDDCMSFPHLLVKLKRYKKCRVDFLDEEGQPQTLYFEDDLAELIQHEYDHLDGILAPMRADDAKSLSAKR